MGFNQSVSPSSIAALNGTQHSFDVGGRGEGWQMRRVGANRKTLRRHAVWRFTRTIAVSASLSLTLFGPHQTETGMGTEMIWQLGLVKVTRAIPCSPACFAFLSPD
jgi:hypothetical protein